MDLDSSSYVNALLPQLATCWWSSQQSVFPYENNPISIQTVCFPSCSLLASREDDPNPTHGGCGWPKPIKTNSPLVPILGGHMT